MHRYLSNNEASQNTVLLNKILEQQKSYNTLLRLISLALLGLLLLGVIWAGG